MFNKYVINTLAILGTLLLLYCIYGYFKTLRNPSLLAENKCFFKNDITMNYIEAIHDCKKTDYESNDDYVKRVNKLVCNCMAHYWGDDAVDKYYQRDIPLWENYIMYIAHLIFPPNKGRGYEFIDYKKAIERGFGLCSQHSLAALDILSKADIQARLVCLQGHVVVTVLSDNDSWYIIDPDFGIVIPFDLETIQNNINLVVPYYLNGDFTPAKNTKEYYAMRIAQFYNQTGNIILPDISYYCGLKNIWVQKTSYVLKWIIPILMIIPFFISKWPKEKKRSSRNIRDRHSFSKSILLGFSTSRKSYGVVSRLN